MSKVYIVGAARTAIGSMGGALMNVPAPKLGAVAIAEAVKRAGLTPADVDEVIMGAVLTAGFGQNVARQAALQAGIGENVCATVVNMLCGSGLKSLTLGRQSIIAGDNDIVAAGGMESMSKAPYALLDARFGYKLFNGAVVDTMINDGLLCAMNHIHMGITAENLAEKYGISRLEQDIYAVESQRKTADAVTSGRFNDEIVPVEITVNKETVQFKTDEFPRPDTNIEKIARLRPAFKEGGTVTAGNSSGINDGAAALMLASEAAVEKRGLKPLAVIKAMGQAGVDPAIMGIGPVQAVKNALAAANWSMDEVELIETNEAFAAQSLSVAKELKLNMDIVNVNGGAIALGHPIGASGARILVTLLYEMEKRGVRKGLAALCIGGGMGIAVAVERES
ncbi:MAG: acetyl-CoA C-acetyltransferase [Defluviitaleaceae bacterium]|nr:acetyl-CoA C-acetyltransferase [Defluviitaleaceae bacterium]MCL2835531.1 acetyl-CoA C-acetyltransferase [Defluviitaleaceae bacterium]